MSDVKVADFDAIIFECGQSLDDHDPEALRLVHGAIEQDKVLAAICMMPALLASAGVLEGKRATSNDGYLPTLKAAGAILAGALPRAMGTLSPLAIGGTDNLEEIHQSLAR